MSALWICAKNMTIAKRSHYADFRLKPLAHGSGHLPGIARRKTRVNALMTRESIFFARSCCEGDGPLKLGFARVRAMRRDDGGLCDAEPISRIAYDALERPLNELVGDPLRD
jgi:hypothetical protein